MSPLIVVSVIFLLSLIGAAVLFKFFESSALVKSRKYKAGGAVAGFIIIYALLYGSFDRIQQSQYDAEECRQLQEVYQVSGKIIPKPDLGHVILAAAVEFPDMDGRFNLEARCLDKTDSNGELRIYVIDQEGEFYPKYVDIDSLENIILELPHVTAETEGSGSPSAK